MIPTPSSPPLIRLRIRLHLHHPHLSRNLLWPWRMFLGTHDKRYNFSKPRNIFSPLNSQKSGLRQVAKAPPPKPSSRPSAIARRPPASPPGPSPGALAAQRARQQLNQYRFLGYLKKGGESQAFLTNGEAIYIVKQGETLEGRIHIHKIDPTTIVLSTKVRETGDNIEATIPLTKEQQG